MLENFNWNQDVKNRLEILINKNQGKNKKVIFDFDNTVLSRDIGEATFAYLVKNNMIIKERIKAISPDFSIGNQIISLDKTVDLATYYEKFMLSASHHSKDDTPAINAYAWMVQAMEGLTPLDIIFATKNVFMDNNAKTDRETGLQTKISNYLIPFFHPETVDLIGNLILKEYDIYFVTASNVWTVRYMVTVELEKLLKEKFKKDLTISPKKVLGLSTLLKDKRSGKLFKDPLLIRENTEQAELYGKMEPEELKNYQLTNQIVYPITAYDGKTTNILKYIVGENERPFLVAGDSPGDYSMLKFSENKLWFARLEKPDYQIQTNRLINNSEKTNWFIQPVLYKKFPGFIQSQLQLENLFKDSSHLLNRYMESFSIFE